MRGRRVLLANSTLVNTTFKLIKSLGSITPVIKTVMIINSHEPGATMLDRGDS